MSILARTFTGDPRLRRQQMVAITNTVNVDEDAKLHGLDKKMRPVISAKVGIPRTTRKWAIMRNGDPTDLTRPMKESWDTPKPKAVKTPADGKAA